MSAINEEILISFDELLKLDNEDISTCVDKCSALRICEKSSACPSKIYNLWVQKLFKAYNLQEFTSKDWQMIIKYLSHVLCQFVENLNPSTDTSKQELEQWWLDSHELLKWLETIMNNLDASILSLIMTFALDIIIRTCKFANKTNFKILCHIQQLVISLINNFLYKIIIKDDNDLEVFNKIILSLCDVGSMISSADIKISIETWRTVAKLSEKFHTSFPTAKTNISAKVEMDWNDKAVMGVFKEVNKVIRCYDQNPCDSLLQIAQFYLKVLRLIVNYSKDSIKTVAAIKLFMEIYTFCQHEMTNKENPKIEVLINKPLFDIFSLVHRENFIEEILLQHLKNGADNFTSCKFVLDYLQVSRESCSTNCSKATPDIEVLLKMFNFLFEGTLIFVDEVKYKTTLENFVVLTMLDSTNNLHKKLCEYVMDSSWIRAYTSMEILSIYYSILLNQQQSDVILKCLEFWFVMWNKLNNSNKTWQQNKKLVEVLLKTILNNVSNDKLQECTSIKFENINIILLMCGNHTEQGVQYLQRTLVQNLKKMQERCMNLKDYKELLNLLEICILKPQLINDFIKENLFITLSGLLTGFNTPEMQRFNEFVHKCLRFFCLQQNQEQSEKLLKYLMDHTEQCCNMLSVFLIEFLLKQRPQSEKLLKALENSNQLASAIINLIDSKLSVDRTLDLKIFKNLPLTYLNLSNHNAQLEQIKKKPRLDKDSFTNVKFILNELNLNAQKLLSFSHSSFDAKDFELLQTIKNNIEKCLRN